MQVIVLAAGMGLRLGHLTRATPKALIPLNGLPLMDYTLPHLLANKQVHEVIVVGGFEFNLLESHIHQNYGLFGDRIRIVQNPHFTKGNLYSLEAALPFLEDDFLIANVDHLFQEKTWKFILQKRQKVTIFCDFWRDFAPDEMKVLLDEKKKLIQMSKTLNDYDCAYVGLTYIPGSSLDKYREAFHGIAKEIGDKAVVENVLPQLAKIGTEIQITAFDKHAWHEVDTREDLKKAEVALSQTMAPAKQVMGYE